MKKFLLVLVCVFSLWLNPAETKATLVSNYKSWDLEVEVYDFEIFTFNGNYYDDPRLSFYVEVSETEWNHVRFEFHNDSTLDKNAISRIYFEGNMFKNEAYILNSPGVYFRHGAWPSDLPGRMLLEPAFDANPEYNISAYQPTPHNGVDPGEWVGAIFDLRCGYTYDDVINSLNNGDLRIGLHIIGLPDGSSESAVNVPEPTSLVLMGIGGLVLIRKKDKKQL